MNLCFLAAASSIHTVRWVNALAKRGHEVHLLTMHPKTKHTIDPQVKVYPLTWPAPFGYYLNLFQAKRYLRQIKPDLLHAHYATGYGTLARKLHQWPIVLSVWGSDVLRFPKRSKRARKLVEKNLHAADAITVTSQKLEKVTKTLAKPSQPIDIIPFGVDLKQFNAQRQKFDPKDLLYIGTVKGLKEVYGIDRLLKAFRLLIDAFQQQGKEKIANQLVLKIVGEGNERRALEQLAKELAIERQTKFIGAIPHTDVPKHLQSLDIYCALSRSESFGVAILEASATELPVIVTNVGGLPEVVQDGKTGYIVEEEDLKTVTLRLKQLVEDQSLRQRLGKRGRQFVKETYSWSAVVPKMENIYHKVKQKSG